MDGWMGGCELDRGLGEGGNRACGPRLAKIEDVLFSVRVVKRGAWFDWNTGMGLGDCSICVRIRQSMRGVHFLVGVCNVSV